MNEQKIKARVSGREAAEEILQAGLLVWPDGYGADFAESFIETIRVALPQRSVQQPATQKPEPIARLGARQMVFGVHKGKRFDEIDLAYLDWICAAQEEFYKDLRAYLKHPELESRRRGCDG